MFESLFLAFLLVFPAYIIYLSFNMTKKKNQKALDKAIERGHVVNAVLVKESVSQRWVPGANSMWTRKGVYEYTYNGKKYKFRMWAKSHPRRRQLYFVKNPAKATVEAALYEFKINWFVVYVVVAALDYIISLL